MSVNSTSVPSTLHSYDLFNYRICFLVFIAFITLRLILILPLSILILYLGHQHWRKQRSFKTASHSDVFTYHTVAMELMWVLGIILLLYGICTNHLWMTTVGKYFSSFTCSGEMCFHVLTCVEWYLAVVHPITYLGLRNARGVRIRNISINCVWLLCFGIRCITALRFPKDSTIPLFSLLVFSIIIISYCGFAVLCVLIRSGPREGGEEKEQVDQSKIRAFRSITAILAILCIWFVGGLVSNALSESDVLSDSVSCVMLTSVEWFNLPCCLALPLLYLQRAGKLSFCQYSKE